MFDFAKSAFMLHLLLSFVFLAPLFDYRQFEDDGVAQQQQWCSCGCADACLHKRKIAAKAPRKCREEGALELLSFLLFYYRVDKQYLKQILCQALNSKSKSFKHFSALRLKRFNEDK